MRRPEVIFGAFETSHKSTPTYIENVVLLPPRVAQTLFLYAKGAVSKTTELLFPRDQIAFAKELAGEHELDKASQACMEIELGQEADIPEIEFSGRADLAKLVIEAGEAETIPWKVTDKIIEMAAYAEVDEEFEPLLDDEEQSHFKKILKKHAKRPAAARDVVQDMFAYKKNKL